MADVLGILFSSLAILFVLMRAALLDQSLPWFEDDNGLPGDTDEADRQTSQAPAAGNASRRI